MSQSENNAFRKAIPPPPLFDSAPTFKTANISIPSFSSAPDPSSAETYRHQELGNDEKRHSFNKYGEDRSRRRQERTSSYDTRNSHHSRRHDSSQSPPHHHRSSRHRSRSPSYKRQSRRKRSRSPSQRHHTSSKNRSVSLRQKENKRRRRPSSSSSSSSEESVVHTGTLNTGISFVMDARGDSENLVYGKNHVYTVPAYKRARGGRILGFPPNIRIDHTQASKPGQIAVVDIAGNRKTATSDFGWKDLDKDFKRIRIRPANKKDNRDPFAEHTDSIPLEDTDTQPGKSTRQQQQQQQQLIDYEMYDTGVDYRSIEGNTVRKSTQPSEIQEEGEVEEGESFNEYIRRRTIEFNRQLDQEPHNVQLWLDFIQFQEDAARGLDPHINGQRSAKDSSSGSKRASLNEVKLSIFEKALELNPQSEKLILAYLNCGTETWETLHLLQTWDKYLKRLPDSIQLWSNYINLRQTNFASFTFTQCVNVFEDALSILMKQARIAEHPDRREDIESLLVYILLRACLFMKQCGYQERAFAVLQAAVEFNLFQPSLFKTVATDYTVKVQHFVDFWDSEALRFGEKGAQGWYEYYRAVDNNEDISEPIIDMMDNEEEEEDEYTTLTDWLAAETSNESKHRLPLRMIQADNELLGTDPFRVPLSDDVKNFLFEITTPGARHSLIYSVLVFLGLPYTPPEVGSNTHFFTDTFTRNDMCLKHFWPAEEGSASSKQIIWYVEGVPMHSENAVAQANPYNIPNSYPVGAPEMFAKYGEWFRCSGKDNIQFNDDEHFAREVFQQLLKVEDSNHLKTCYLAFEASCGYKMGRKLAKALLKEHNANLSLWNAYACMERSYGRVEEARKVYITAITMSHNQESQRLYIPLLYYMLAKLELDCNRPAEALKVLTSISGNQPYDGKTPAVTTPVVLRTREYFSQNLVQLSMTSDIYAERQAAINLTRCCALFEYLSSGLDSACSIYEQAVKYMIDSSMERGYESEMVWTNYATLVYQHAKNATSGKSSSSSGDDFYKPARLRHLTERALALFPNNTMFLAFYIWNESRTKIYNRAQQLLNDALSRDSNVVLWLSAIYSEVHRHRPYQATLVRDFFERSVEDPRTRASIVLWKLYIQFETMQNNYERAKTLFYQAIRECPWSKELYLQGIKLFGSKMDARETNELVNVMMEKEIRIRIPIEEHLLE